MLFHFIRWCGCDCRLNDRSVSMFFFYRTFHFVVGICWQWIVGRLLQQNAISMLISMQKKKWIQNHLWNDTDNGNTHFQIDKFALKPRGIYLFRDHVCPCVWFIWHSEFVLFMLDIWEFSIKFSSLHVVAELLQRHDNIPLVGGLPAHSNYWFGVAFEFASVRIACEWKQFKCARFNCPG